MSFLANLRPLSAERKVGRNRVGSLPADTDSSAPPHLFHEDFGEDSLTLKTGGWQVEKPT